MTEWDKLNQLLDAANRKHQALSARFLQFAIFLDDDFASSRRKVMGIGVEFVEGQLKVTFAGRKLLFVLSSPADGAGSLSGKVSCYLEKIFPECELVSLGSFRLNSDGTTDLTDQDNDDKIIINDGPPALYVIMTFLRKALVSPC